MDAKVKLHVGCKMKQNKQIYYWNFTFTFVKVLSVLCLLSCLPLHLYVELKNVHQFANWAFLLYFGNTWFSQERGIYYIFYLTFTEVNVEIAWTS